MDNAPSGVADGERLAKRNETREVGPRDETCCFMARLHDSGKVQVEEMKKGGGS